MKIRFCEFIISYNMPLIIRRLELMGHEVDQGIYYMPDDRLYDEKLSGIVEADIRDGNYDLVISYNYEPIVSRACHNFGIPYIAWCFDSPVYLPLTEEAKYDTTFIFLFDRLECQMRQKQGLNTVYYMPLAIDTEYWDTIPPLYGLSHEISFVGQLYNTQLRELLAGLSDYNRGYMRSLVAAQHEIYGYSILDDLITEDLVKAVNLDLEKSGAPFRAGFEELFFVVNTCVTNQDRLSLLALLSRRHEVALYSKEPKAGEKELLPNVDFRGQVPYLGGMAQTFKISKINLCPCLRAIRSGIPLRALDIMGCKGFLLASYQSDLAEYFVDGVDLVLYDSMEDAVRKADYYLEHDSEREAIAASGYEKVRSEFRLEDRLNQMIAIAMEKRG